MADRAREMERNRDLCLLWQLLRYQDQVGRFRMLPVDYEANGAIARTFDVPGDEFYRLMEAELQTPSVEYLRIFSGVFHRGSLGNVLIMLDHTLFLFPVSQYCLLRRFLYCAHHIDPNWNGARVLEREQASMLASLSLVNFDIVRRRQPQLPAWTRNSHSHPSEAFICFLSWCQEFAARFTMPQADYRLYASLTGDVRRGHVTYVEFLGRMRGLLEHPSYEALRVWWDIHQLSLTGMIRLEEHPLVLLPLELCIRYCVHRFCAMFGNAAWDNYLDSVRRQREADRG